MEPKTLRIIKALYFSDFYISKGSLDTHKNILFSVERSALSETFLTITEDTKNKKFKLKQRKLCFNN